MKKSPEEEPKSVAEQHPEAVHTYFTDVVGVRGSNDEGVLAAKLREDRQRAEEEQAERELHRGRIWWVILSIILVIGGALALLVVLDAIEPPQIQTNQARSLIKADYVINIDLANTATETVTSSIQNAINQIDQDGFSAIRLNQQGRDLLWNELTAVLGLSVPDELQTSTNPVFSYGVYKTGGQRIPFLVLETPNTNVAATGLRNWEPTMTNDLRQLFPLEQFDTLQDDTLVTFESTVINNQTVRVGEYSYTIITDPADTTDVTEDPSQLSDEVFSLDDLFADFDAAVSELDAIENDTDMKTGVLDAHSEEIIEPGVMYYFVDNRLIVIGADTRLIGKIERVLVN
jgi:hypothetical protein